MSHGYKGVTVRLQLGPFVRRRKLAGREYQWVGWCIPESYEEEGGGFRRNRAFAGFGGVKEI